MEQLYLLRFSLLQHSKTPPSLPSPLLHLIYSPLHIAVLFFQGGGGSLCLAFCLAFTSFISYSRDTTLPGGSQPLSHTCLACQSICDLGTTTISRAAAAGVATTDLKPPGETFPRSVCPYPLRHCRSGAFLKVAGKNILVITSSSPYSFDILETQARETESTAVVLSGTFKIVSTPSLAPHSTFCAFGVDQRRVCVWLVIYFRQLKGVEEGAEGSLGKGLHLLKL